MPGLDALFDALWRSYTAVTPSASLIHEALARRGEPVVNDHVALRTFDLEPIGLEAIASHFIELGYEATGDYTFEVKHLKARSFSREGAPRVFISELITGAMPPHLLKVLRVLVDQIDGELTVEMLSGGRPWVPVSWDTYRSLREASEYAAWVAAFGLRANHFTVSVNALSSFGPSPLEGLCVWLKAQGHALNESGGEIKGGPAQGLEQASTLADRVSVDFADEIHGVPSCYVEFALRHPDPITHILFDGFVTESADRIFESTEGRAT